MASSFKKAISASVLVTFGVALGSTANAQTVQAPPAGVAPVPPNGGVQEIVVTAEKRRTNLQRTPISITVLSGNTLRSEQIRHLEDVAALVPAMQMGENDSQAQITIRGIGISAVTPALEAAVAVNLNEVYVSRPAAQLTGLYDVASIEVLRGPQGTLYGRNATAGSVNITTTRPTGKWSGYANVTVGNYAAVTTEAAVGGPIIGDTVLFRIAGLEDEHSGYGKNLVTGHGVDNKNVQAVRGTLVVNATPELKATVIGEYYHERDNGAGDHYFGAAGLVNLPGTIGVEPVFIQQGGFAPSNEQDVASPVDSQFYLQTADVTGLLEWTHGPFSVRSITGYREQEMHATTPLDAGSTDNAIYFYGEPDHQVSEELQGHFDTSSLHVTGGLYYFHELDDANPGVAVFSRSMIEQAFGVPYTGPDGFVDFVENGGTIRTSSKAAFGQVSYEILDGLSLIGGLRYSTETKTAYVRSSFSLTAPYDLNAPPSPPTAVVEGPRTWDSMTPKFGFEYQVTPKTLLYGTYAKGFRSGNFDTSELAPAYNPEKVTDYEGGLKTTFLDNTLRTNLGGFYYDYNNLQVTQVIGVTAVTANAATATIYGGEAEITAKPVPPLELDFAASYLHARYGHYVGPSAVQSNLPSVDFTGRTLDNAPDFSGHAAATYTWQVATGSVAGRAEVEYSSRTYFTPDNIDLLSQSPYAKENLFLTYSSVNNWHATAFVKNLTNITTRTAANVNTPVLGSPARGSVAAPRTFGLEVGYQF